MSLIKINISLFSLRHLIHSEKFSVVPIVKIVGNCLAGTRKYFNYMFLLLNESSTKRHQSVIYAILMRVSYI